MPRRMSSSIALAENNEKPLWATRIREIRGGRSQVAFARLCNVSQVTISRWEAGTDRPLPSAYARLAALSGDPYRSYFWDLSGFGGEFPQGQEKNRGPGSGSLLIAEPRSERTLKGAHRIPILENGLLAGISVRAGEECVSDFLAMPKSWFSASSKLCAVQINDNSMTPLIRRGNVVVLDTSITDPTKLVGTLIAVVLDARLVIRWLCVMEKLYFLAPTRMFERKTEIVPFKPKGSIRIIGTVVRWIASAPKKELRPFDVKRLGGAPRVPDVS